MSWFKFKETHTRVCQIQKGASGIPLHPQIVRVGEPDQVWNGTTSCNFHLVRRAGGKVGETAARIALHLDEIGEKQPNKVGQAVQLDNQ